MPRSTKQAVKGESASETLDKRESVYGSFETHSMVSQGIKSVLQAHPGWGKLNSTQKEAAEMIAHKLARIVNGDPDYTDNWHDISGYSELAEREIKNRVGNQNPGQDSTSQTNKPGPLSLS